MSTDHPPASRNRSLRYMPAFFVLWALLLSFIYFGFGPLSYVKIHDNGDHIPPFKIRSAHALIHGDLTAWAPEPLCGIDAHAPAYMSHLEVIDFLFFAALPGWLAYGLILFLQRLLAGYFTFRLLNDTLGCGVVPAAYGGMFMAAFASSAFPGVSAGFTLSTGFGVPGLPLVLWALNKIADARHYRSYMYAAGIGLLWSLSSVFVFTLFLMPFVCFWFLFITPRLHLTFWIKLFLFACMWLLGSLPVVLATLSLTSLSHRADWDTILRSSFEASLSKSWQFLSDIAVPVALGIAGLVAVRGKSYRLIVLLMALALILAIIASYSVLVDLLMSPLGWLVTIQFNRVYRCLPLLAAVIGGVGLHALSQRVRWSLAGYTISLRTIAVLVAAGAIVWQQVSLQSDLFRRMRSGDNYQAIYANPDIEHLAATADATSPFRVATIAARNEHPGYAWSYGLETADGYINLYPQRYQDYWGKVIEPLTDRSESRHWYFHEWGNRAYLFAPPDGLLPDQSVAFAENYDLKLLSLANVRYIFSPFKVTDETLVLLPSPLLEERYENWLELRIHEKIWLAAQGKYPSPMVYIYENPGVLPRFFLVERVEIRDTSEQVLEALQQASYDALRSTAYLSAEDTGTDLPTVEGGSGMVQLVSYGSDRIVLDVRADANTMLVITNSYNPYWQVRISGELASIVPVDHTFQGVFIEPGQHEIVLSYEPPYLPR